MNILIRVFVSAMFSILAAGCVSAPAYKEFAGVIYPPLPLDGRIYFYRTSGLVAAMQPVVKVDGEEVGKATPSGFFYVDRLAGNHEISIKTKTEKTLSVTLGDSEVKYVRFDVNVGVFVGDIEPVLVDAAIGQEELKEMLYTGELTVATR